MKVCDLIEKLKTCNPDAEAVAFDPGGALQPADATEVVLWRDQHGYYHDDSDRADVWPAACVRIV